MALPDGPVPVAARLEPRGVLDRRGVRPGVPAHLRAVAALDVHRPLVGPDVGAAALRVVHDVLAAPGDDADVDRAAGGTGARHAVVATVEVHAHLLGLGGEEAPPEPGRSAPVREGDRDLHRVVGPARERHDLGLVRRVHVHLLRVVAVDAEDVVDEAGPPRHERRERALPVDRVPRRRHLPQRVVDDVVGEPALQVRRDLLPGRGVEVGEEPAVHLEVVRERPLELGRVLLAELELLRDGAAHGPHHQPVVVDEDHVRVLRQAAAGAPGRGSASSATGRGGGRSCRARGR